MCNVFMKLDFAKVISHKGNVEEVEVVMTGVQGQTKLTATSVCIQ